MTIYSAFESTLFPVCCSMSSSNYSFLTWIQISQEAGQVVWYSHLLKNFPQFVVIHTVKGFGIVSKAEVGVFLELSCFFNDPGDVGNLTSGFSAFSKSSLHIWKFSVQMVLKPLLKDLEYYLASVWNGDFKAFYFLHFNNKQYYTFKHYTDFKYTLRLLRMGELHINQV